MDVEEVVKKLGEDSQVAWAMLTKGIFDTM